jgi:hypothetical protein
MFLRIIKTMLKNYFLLIVWYFNPILGQKLIKIWETEAEFKVPESVIYHKPSGKIFVSNISGEAWAFDKDGFISIIDKKGNIEKLKWIENFDSPKGMGIVGDNLYVADINKVKVVSISKGMVMEEIEIDDAYNLNDITVDENGVVYISDSYHPTIYELINGKVSKWYSNKSMEMINGLDVDGHGLVVLEMKNGRMSHVSHLKHHKHIVDKLYNADGVVTLGKDEYFVSNWDGIIYYVKNGNVHELLNLKKENMNAADICFIPGDNILVIPTFYANKVVAYKFIK